MAGNTMRQPPPVNVDTGQLPLTHNQVEVLEVLGGVVEEHLQTAVDLGAAACRQKSGEAACNLKGKAAVEEGVDTDDDTDSGWRYRTACEDCVNPCGPGEAAAIFEGFADDRIAAIQGVELGAAATGERRPTLASMLIEVDLPGDGGTVQVLTRDALASLDPRYSTKLRAARMAASQTLGLFRSHMRGPLDERQRRAIVDLPYDTPGTGETRIGIIACRIGDLLSNTDALVQIDGFRARTTLPQLERVRDQLVSEGVIPSTAEPASTAESS